MVKMGAFKTGIAVFEQSQDHGMQDKWRTARMPFNAKQMASNSEICVRFYAGSYYQYWRPHLTT